MIVSFGSLNADLIFEMDAVPTAGQTLLARSFRMEAGGKGANQAVAAARSGGSVAMVGSVGKDALAGVALQNLVEAGVDISRVGEDDLPTGCASIYVDEDGRNQIAVALGANKNARASQVDNALLAKANVLLMQMESDPVEVEALLQRAREANVYSILNLAPAIRLDITALRLCSLLIVNEDEADIASGWLDCAPTAPALSAVLGTSVLRTMGARGAELMSEGTYSHVPARKIAPVDTTAAGDCFIGVLASGLDQGMSVETSMVRATAASALCCKRKGSQSSLPWDAEINRYLLEAA